MCQYVFIKERQKNATKRHFKVRKQPCKLQLSCSLIVASRIILLKLLDFIFVFQGHSNPGEFVCVACGEKFGKNFQLNFHLQQMGPFHNGQCATCRKVIFISPLTENSVDTHHSIVPNVAFSLFVEYHDAA